MRNGDPRAAQTLKAQLRLRQMILDGELSAGERVPELMLVERTGVSRTPIRAALLRLAEEGAARTVHFQAASSCALSTKPMSTAQIDVRGMLEGAAARRAAQRRPSRADLSDMRDCVGAMEAIVERRTLGVEQFLDFVRLNGEQYHSLLVGLARSPVLTRAVRAVIGWRCPASLRPARS